MHYIVGKPNLPAVVRRTAVYPVKLMRGGKRYSFTFVHDTVGVYMYVKLQQTEKVHFPQSQSRVYFRCLALTNILLYKHGNVNATHLYVWRGVKFKALSQSSSQLSLDFSIAVGSKVG